MNITHTTRSTSPAARAPRALSLLALTLAGTTGLCLQAADVEIRIRNLAPANGTYLTPLWVGFHNGGFDLFNAGSPASAALPSLAEDGMTGGVGMDFASSGAGSASGTIIHSAGFPPFAPGTSASMVFSVNPFDPKARYLSFAAMVIPSNDGFIGNDDPMMIQVFDALGGFVGGTFTLYGSMVWDAGTEVNDEIPANTAFLGQMTPNTGVDENGTVGIHPGFNAPGSGGILDNPMFSTADFKQGLYPVAELTISAVPEPREYAILAGLGLTGFAAWRRRRRA